MSTISNTAAREPDLNWIVTGPAAAATVILVHPVGFDLTYWDRQIDALRSAYRVVAFDLPGHGRSGGGPQDCTFDTFSAAVARLIRMAGPGPAHVVGLSVGGMVAQHTALAYPELTASLTLIGTAATFPEPVRSGMRARAAAVRDGGMQAVLQSSLERWFTPATLQQRPHLIERVTKTVLADDPLVHGAMWDMIAAFDVHARLGEISCPALVLVGVDDPSTPPAMTSAMAEAIRGARLVVLPQASHLVTLEAPEAINAELLGFLAAL